VEKWNKAINIARLRTDFDLTPSRKTTPIDKYLAEPGNEESKIKEIREKV